LGWRCDRREFGSIERALPTQGSSHIATNRLIIFIVENETLASISLIATPSYVDLPQYRSSSSGPEGLSERSDFHLTFPKIQTMKLMPSAQMTPLNWSDI